ncbi:MAG: PD-(D/E)XK motif protein [Verrucomicrobium sp.]|nr:PD-(D/E)XK motif protein [Verrucomicrobium sp.]
MNIKEAWSKIGESGVHGFIARRLSPNPSDQLYAAMDTARNVRMLVLACKGPLTREIRTILTSSEGYATKYAVLDLSSRSQPSIIIESTAGTPIAVFESLCEDVATSVLQRSPSQEAEEVFSGRLLLWRRLFESRRTEGLGFEERLGLLAELTHLKDLILAGGDPLSVLTWWTGPEKLTTDFQSPHARTEVKATATKRQYKIRIHGERQLESLDHRPLSLVAMMFERVVADGVSLPEEVATIRHLLGTGVAEQMFGSKLLEGGYLSAHEEEYRGESLRLVERREYQVGKEFPHIASESIPEGVGDLGYSLDLSACEPFRMKEGSAISALLGKGGE